MLKKCVLISLIILASVCCVPTKKTQPTEEVATSAKAYFTGTVIRDNINIRSSSSTSGSVLGTVNDGEPVRILQNENGWYQIVTNEKVNGWVRSDFVGTKYMSYNLRVENFADSTLQGYAIEMFIDEKDPYAIIYMILPEDLYEDKSSAQNLVKQLGKQYQEKVYPGKVEIRILKNDRKTLFGKVDLKKRGAVNLKAPFLVKGRLYSFKLLDGHSLKIKVLIPAGLSDKMLYDMSSDISANYDNDIRKIEIYFIEDNSAGIAYLNRTDNKSQKNSTCRFYYLEDKNGPYYKANFCN